MWHLLGIVSVVYKFLLINMRFIFNGNDSTSTANFVTRPDYGLIKGKNLKDDEFSEVVYDWLFVLNAYIKRRLGLGQEETTVHKADY
jgi:hypothetical protein